jgi:hypothetical protein
MYLEASHHMTFVMGDCPKQHRLENNQEGTVKWVKVGLILTGEAVSLGARTNGKCLWSYDFIDKNRYCSMLMRNMKVQSRHASRF